MIFEAVFTAALLVQAASSPAASGAGICVALNSRIEDDQKTLATLGAEGLGDDSAPRATMRAAQATEAVSEAQANIALLEAHHCSAYARPISDGAYMNDALVCHLARVKATDATAIPECDQTKWTPH